MVLGDTSNYMNRERKTTKDKLEDIGQFIQEFLKDLCLWLATCSTIICRAKLKNWSIRLRSLQILSLNSSESMENASKSLNFVTITSNSKMTEILKSEACSVTTSLKKVKNRQSLTLEQKILHHSWTINSK